MPDLQLRAFVKAVAKYWLPLVGGAAIPLIQNVVALFTDRPVSLSFWWFAAVGGLMISVYCGRRELQLKSLTRLAVGLPGETDAAAMHQSWGLWEEHQVGWADDETPLMEGDGSHEVFRASVKNTSEVMTVRRVRLLATKIPPHVWGPGGNVGVDLPIPLQPRHYAFDGTKGLDLTPGEEVHFDLVDYTNDGANMAELCAANPLGGPRFYLNRHPVISNPSSRRRRSSVVGSTAYSV